MEGQLPVGSRIGVDDGLARVSHGSSAWGLPTGRAWIVDPGVGG